MLGCVYSYILLIAIYFFKQKTAYDMRISDWSSDVCSSDLIASLEGGYHGTDWQLHPRRKRRLHRRNPHPDASRQGEYPPLRARQREGARPPGQRIGRRVRGGLDQGGARDRRGISEPQARRSVVPGTDLRDAQRSEEHTSELQSLMRTSYAVF